MVESAAGPFFITGASGFVGRAVVAALSRAGIADVRLLVRNPEAFAASVSTPPTWRLVRGDLADATPWRDALQGVDQVLHLASATGKVSRGTYHDVIVGGTSRLLDAAKSAGVRRILFVSSVAAGFEDQRHYHYAVAKRDAESRVQASGLESLIVRPTMVFGPGGALLTGLRKLTTLPVPIVFGNGTPTVQPIDVGDLAALLLIALGGSAAWHGETVTVGGPDVVTTEALLQRIHALGSLSASGTGAREPARFLHIPIEPLRTVLALLEPVLLPVLPFTAGQLASFANAGVVGAQPELLREWLRAMPAPLRSLDEMLRASVAAASVGAR